MYQGKHIKVQYDTNVSASNIGWGNPGFDFAYMRTHLLKYTKIDTCFFRMRGTSLKKYAATRQKSYHGIPANEISKLLF